MADVTREEFFRRLTAAFAALEKAVAEGKIRAYGAATWNAFRVGLGSAEALSLPEILRVASEVGGKDHHFRAIQLPFNFAMPEALTANTQSFEGSQMPVLQVARSSGLLVFASATLLQGKLTQGLPSDLQKWFHGLEKDSQRAVQFVRSTPGVTCALIGMSRPEHVDENLATATVPRLSLEDFRTMFAKG